MSDIKHTLLQYLKVNNEIYKKVQEQLQHKKQASEDLKNKAKQAVDKLASLGYIETEQKNEALEKILDHSVCVDMLDTLADFKKAEMETMGRSVSTNKSASKKSAADTEFEQILFS